MTGQVEPKSSRFSLVMKRRLHDAIGHEDTAPPSPKPARLQQWRQFLHRGGMTSSKRQPSFRFDHSYSSPKSEPTLTNAVVALNGHIAKAVDDRRRRRRRRNLLIIMHSS